ncbi:MAG: hypothetical protein NW200_00325 [Hyphomonadaceae bacterium]|nr:hypothetical protein [Hyphomonadaceae bacterium]
MQHRQGLSSDAHGASSKPLPAFLKGAGGDAPRPALVSLKGRLARLADFETTAWGGIPLGDPRIDSFLPPVGLPRGCVHEVCGAGLEAEIPASAAGFAAMLARKLTRQGATVWALSRPDIYAPGLQSLGLTPDRLIFVRTRSDAETFAVLEDALRTRGVDCAIGEAAVVSLVAGKRLQLACESAGGAAIVLRRQSHAPRTTRKDPTTAATRWAIGPAPAAPDGAGLGALRWRTVLQRCRGGRTGAWILEACDETGDVRVVEELADHAPGTVSGERPESRRPGARDGGDDRQRTASVGG